MFVGLQLTYHINQYLFLTKDWTKCKSVNLFTIKTFFYCCINDNIELDIKRLACFFYVIITTQQRNLYKIIITTFLFDKVNSLYFFKILSRYLPMLSCRYLCRPSVNLTIFLSEMSFMFISRRKTYDLECIRHLYTAFHPLL